MFNFEVTFQPKQGEAFRYCQRSENRGQYLFYGGAKGGGKSYLVRGKEFSRRLMFPGTTGVIIRKTFPELLANHIRKFWQEYPITKKWYRASEKSIYYPNGSVTDFKYLSSTDDVYNYQGIEYDDITLDEATQHEEEVFKILKTSLRSDPLTIRRNPNFKPIFLLTGNPGGIGHQWVKRIFVSRDFNSEETPRDFHFIQAKIYDNPIFVKANPEYLKNLQDLPEDLRKAYLDGDWDIFIGQFFKDWRNEIHVVEPFAIDPYWGKCFALDWGYDPHPFHAGWYAQDFQGNIYKYREFEGVETPPEDVAAKIVELSQLDKGIKHGVGDTQMWTKNPFVRNAPGEVPTNKSIAQSVNTTLQRAGLFMFQATKDRITGWTNLRSLMKWEGTYNDDGTRNVVRVPKYRIFSTCHSTIAAYPNQIHSELRPEDMMKIEGDDPCDTDRYALMYMFKGAKPKQQATEVQRLRRLALQRTKGGKREFAV